jgi:hypothetical protein
MAVELALVSLRAIVLRMASIVPQRRAGGSIISERCSGVLRDVVARRQ